MTRPKTLFEWSGVAPDSVDAAQAAVVTIDCQREYLDGALPLSGVEPALERIGALLTVARSRGLPIVHVVHQGAPGTLFDPTTPRAALCDQLAARADEPRVSKRLPDSFAGTELQAVLQRLGRGQILFCGFMTHMCVSATVRTALNLGLRSLVAGDGCATRDLPAADGSGGVVAAAALHAATLAALADRYATVRAAAELAAQMGR